MGKKQPVAVAAVRSLVRNGFGWCSALPAHATALFQDRLYRYRYAQKRGQ